MFRVLVDVDLLREAAQQKNLSSFEAVSGRATEMGISLGVMTLYNFAHNRSNWTRNTLQNVCQVLDCDPRQILVFTQGNE